MFCWEKDHWGPGRIEEEIFGVPWQSMMGHWVSRGKEGKQVSTGVLGEEIFEFLEGRDTGDPGRMEG